MHFQERNMDGMISSLTYGPHFKADMSMIYVDDNQTTIIYRL